METKDEHARRNAEAWLANIVEMTDALGQFRNETEDLESVTIDGEAFTSEDAVTERIRESPLSIQVRGGWYIPGEKEGAAEEFEILLSTGGPALRIIGELDEYAQPSRPCLQYQDWGTPWTEYIIPAESQRDALQTFCEEFYFGD